MSVGPVSKDDVMKALKNVVLEDPNKRKKEFVFLNKIIFISFFFRFACMLVFDVKVLADAYKYAEEFQIKIFEANIIYHLFDQFLKYVDNCREERKKQEARDIVFPSVLKVYFLSK